MSQAYPSVRDAAGVLLTLQSATVDAPALSAAVVVYIWNNYNAAAADAVTLRNAVAVLEILNGSDWNREGERPADQLYGQFRITGYQNDGDDDIEDLTTGWRPIGASSRIPLGDIPSNAARIVEFRWAIPSGAASGAFSAAITIDSEDTSYPLAEFASLGSGSGVLYGDTSATTRRVVRGGAATGAAAILTIAARRVAWDGSFFNRPSETATLNQSDSAAAALAVGESYVALITQGDNDAITTTKGVKGVAPADPTMPADRILLARVAVQYDAAATDLAAEDISIATSPRGEYDARIDTGLTIIVSAGDAISGLDRYQFAGASSPVVCTDDDTTYIWLLPGGGLSAELTGTAPEVGAELLWEAVASAGAVTSLTDRRKFAGRAVQTLPVTLSYSGDITGSVAEFGWFTVPAGDWLLERLDAELGTLGAGASSGSFKILARVYAEGEEIDGTGTTIHTSGPETLAPSIAYNAASLVTEGYYHQVTEFSGGQRLSASLASIPAGTFTTDATDLRVTFNLRRQ